MPNPHPTIYLKLHPDLHQIDAFTNPEGTDVLNEIEVSANGGKIFVKFINHPNRNVLTGKISLATDPTHTPFATPKVLVHDQDNGNGSDHNPVDGNKGPTPIRNGLTVGDRFNFDITGTWQNGTRSAGKDPTIIIKN